MVAETSYNDLDATIEQSMKNRRGVSTVEILIMRYMQAVLLPCDAMLDVNVVVMCHMPVLYQKRLNIGSCKQCTGFQESGFVMPKILAKLYRITSPNGGCQTEVG